MYKQIIFSITLLTSFGLSGMNNASPVEETGNLVYRILHHAAALVWKSRWPKIKMKPKQKLVEKAQETTSETVEKVEPEESIIAKAFKYTDADLFADLDI